MSNTIIHNSVPGLGSEQTYTPKEIFWTVDGRQYAPGYYQTNGSVARDVNNTASIRTLEPGLLMGKVTASGLFAPSILGAITVAFTASQTVLTVSTAVATEISRRIGATGILTMAGPPSAAGTVASTPVTYSAINTTTGVLTITGITSASWILGSVIRPTDGSETPLGVLDQFVQVVDDDGTNKAANIDKLAIQGSLDPSQLQFYPSDTSLKAWFKGLLNAPSSGPGPFKFKDNYVS